MKTLAGEMAGYAAASACALMVDVGVLALPVHYCSWWYIAAASVSFMMGLLIAYLLSTHLVFSQRKIRSRRIEFLSFAGLGVIGLALNAAVIFGAVRYVGLNFLTAKCVAAGFTFICNFISRRQLLFVQAASA